VQELFVVLLSSFCIKYNKIKKLKFIEKKKSFFFLRGKKSAESRDNFILTLFSNLFDKDDKSASTATLSNNCEIYDFEIIQVSQIIFTNIIHYSTTILSSLLSIVNNIFQL